MTKVLVLCGPTSTGKTSLSLLLAEKFNGEIINGDSMQVYKEMNIGTAKIKENEMRGIPHHLFDIKTIKDAFSIAEYQTLVRSKIEEITERNKLPIIVGGTGLYLKSALYDYEFREEKQVNNELNEKSLEELNTILESLDPLTYSKIDKNNKRRVIRAIEIFQNQGVSKEINNDLQKHMPIYDVLFIGLTRDRKELYSLIDKRVDEMVEEGLIDEAKNVYENADISSTSRQAIGYKELFSYFNNEIRLDEAIQKIKFSTHQFAKRQYTWFKHQMDVKWIDVNNNNYICDANKLVEEWL